MERSAAPPPWPRWTLIFAFWAAAWAIFAVLRIALVFWLDPADGDDTRLLALVDYGIQYGLWALLTPAIFWLSWRFPVTSRNWVRLVPFHLSVGFAVVVATMVTMFFLHNHYAHPASDRHPWVVTEIGKQVILYGYHYHVLFYMGILTAGFAVSFYHGLQEQQLTSARLHAQMTEARMHALRMQLHPHFLFNTLNTISNMTEQDPKAARRVIARLSELLRRALESTQEQEVPLADEVRFAKSYLEIVRERFPERVHVDFSIDERTLSAAVPNLILQPILENAVEHGISRSLGPGIIEVRSTEADGILRVEIIDNGPGIGAASHEEGVGLANTRARLQQLYGDDGALELQSPPGGGLHVEISLPYRVLTAHQSDLPLTPVW